VPYKGYVIFFRYERGWFEIVNIREGHLDVERYFAERARPDSRAQ
jgi:hypothetical protein